MHNDVARPERQYGSCSSNPRWRPVALVVGEIVKVRDIELDPKSNKSLEPLLDVPATSEHTSEFLPFKFPASGIHDVILDSFVTTTPTMFVRAAKALFGVIMHSVYCAQEKLLHIFFVFTFFSFN